MGTRTRASDCLVHAVLAEQLQDRVAPAARAEHPDVADVGGERVAQHGQVVLVVVRHQHQRGRRR